MIYIDLGCHNGNTIKEFYKTHDRKIMSIGIDPLGKKYAKEWAEVFAEYGTRFFKYAAMDFDGEVDFSERPDDVKSSVMKEKDRFDKGKISKVDCFNFSEYIKQFREGVYLRMDIEGAEYPVLNQMILDRTIFNIDFLEIEWHSQKMLNPKYQEEEQLIKKFLDENNIQYKEFI